jgi:hypothetical protein
MDENGWLAQRFKKQRRVRGIARLIRRRSRWTR